MFDLLSIKKSLLFIEHREAVALYNEAQAAGYSPVMIAALAYKHGLTTGKRGEKAILKKVYKELAAARERIAVLESSESWHKQIHDLVSNPSPDREIPELTAAPDPTDNKPTPGDEQEDVNNE